MANIYDTYVKILIKQVGKGTLKPVSDISEATKMHHFNMIRKKRNSFFSWLSEERDILTEFTLMDILEPNPSIPEMNSTEPIHLDILAVLKGMFGVDVSVNTGPGLGTSGESTKFQQSSLYFQFIRIPPEAWKDLLKRKTLEKKPEFLNRCRKRKENLYVVTEIMILTEETTLHEIRHVKGGGELSIFWNPYSKGKVEGKCLKLTEAKLVLPKGTVMAYERKQLVLTPDGWEILRSSDDDEQSTFQDVGAFPTDAPKKSVGNPVRLFSYCPGTPSYKKAKLYCSKMKQKSAVQGWHPPLREDFEHLQKEISKEMEVLVTFPKNLRDTLFQNILAMLGNRGALQNLMDMLDENPSGDMVGPGGTILKELRKNSREESTLSENHIIHLLEALMVLSNTQHDLLAKSMKMRILVQQRELVRSILEPHFMCAQSTPFTLNPELLTGLGDEGVDITYGLLEECGLPMEPDSPESTWDSEVKPPLSALYGAISLLQQLADP